MQEKNVNKHKLENTIKKRKPSQYETPVNPNTAALKTKLSRLRQGLDLLLERGDLGVSDITRLKNQNEKLVLENRLKLQEIENLKQKHNQMVIRQQNRKTNTVRLYERIKEEFFEQVKPALYHNIGTYKKQIEELEGDLERYVKERQNKQSRYSEELAGIKKVYEKEIGELKRTADEMICKEIEQIEVDQEAREIELKKQIDDVVKRNEKQVKLNNNLEEQLEQERQKETENFVNLKKELANGFENLFNSKKEELKKTYIAKTQGLENSIKNLQIECAELEKLKKELKDCKQEQELESIKNSLNDKNEKSLELFKKKLEIRLKSLKKEEEELIKKVESVNSQIIENHEQQAIKQQNKQMTLEADFQARFNTLVEQNEKLTEELNMLEFENKKLEESHRNQINIYFQIKKDEFDAYQEELNLKTEERNAKELISKKNTFATEIAKNNMDELNDEIINLKNSHDLRQQDLKDSEKYVAEKIKEQDALYENLTKKLENNTTDEARLKLKILNQLKLINEIHFSSITGI